MTTRWTVSISFTGSPSEKFHCGFEGPPSFLSQRDELGSPVMRVDLECDETLFVQVVDDPLHILTIGAEVASKPRNGLRTFGVCDGAKDLPSGACQPKTRHQPIARLLSLNRSSMRLVRASPAGVRLVFFICHHKTLLTSLCQYEHLRRIVRGDGVLWRM
jgi:hypothetical protein